MSFFDKIKNGLQKTATSLSAVFQGATELDDEFFDELEERLILSDMGAEAAMEAVDALRGVIRENKLKTAEEARLALRGILAGMLDAGDSALHTDTKPSVVLFVGVNGVGKTTSIGKIAHQLRQDGKNVLLCAADTFRAAAADPLEIWAQRSGTKTWTTDAFYRETVEEIEKRKSEGCICVEMELSACQAVCDHAGIELYGFLYRADNLDCGSWEKGQRDSLLSKDDRLTILNVALQIAKRI